MNNKKTILDYNEFRTQLGGLIEDERSNAASSQSPETRLFHCGRLDLLRTVALLHDCCLLNECKKTDDPEPVPEDGEFYTIRNLAAGFIKFLPIISCRDLDFIGSICGLRRECEKAPAYDGGNSGGSLVEPDEQFRSRIRKFCNEHLKL